MDNFCFKVGLCVRIFTPEYDGGENESLASAVGEHFVLVEEDADGINPETLEARFEGAVTLDKWYVSRHC